jgi:hypothetical protein
MNIAMEQTEEYIDGQLKARYGDCFVRGNNGKFIIQLFVQYLIFWVRLSNMYALFFSSIYQHG